MAHTAAQQCRVRIEQSNSPGLRGVPAALGRHPVLARLQTALRRLEVRVRVADSRPEVLDQALRLRLLADALREID